MSQKHYSWLRLSFDVWRASFEAQQVIALRLAMLAVGGIAGTLAGDGTAWYRRQDAAAALEAQRLAATAVLTGNAAQIPSRTVALYRRKMRANRSRLTAAKSPSGRPRRAKKARPT